jgi:hypothetical protein
MTPTPPTPTGRRFIFAAAAVCLIVLAAQLAFVALDRTDQFNGYEHQVFDLLLAVAHDRPTAEFTVGLHRAPLDAGALLGLTAELVRLVGLHTWVLLVLPLLGWAAMLFFGYHTAVRLSGEPRAGWLAAALLALCPFVFGVARRFCPWTLIMGDYLAVIYLVIVLTDRPTLLHALLLGLATALGVFLPHEPTPLMLFLAHVTPPIAWGLLLVAISRNRRWPAKVLYVVVVLAIVGAALVFWEGRIRFYDPHYAGYAPILARNLIGLWGTVVVLAGFAAFPHFRRRPRDLFWFALPVALLVVMSVIPKKSPWYVMDFLPLAPILAAVAIVGWLQNAGRRKTVAVTAAVYGGLLAQYVLMSFLAYFPAGTLRDWCNALTPYQNLAARPVSDDLSGGGPSFRAQTDLFLAHFDELFPARKEIRLGLMTEWMGYHMIPFYLRLSGRRLVLDDVLAHPAEEAGRLDGVVVITSYVPGGWWSRSLADPRGLDDTVVRGYLEAHPWDAARKARAHENARRLLDELRDWRGVDLNAGVAVWRPRGP